MDAARFKTFIHSVASAVIDNADELTALDQAIGDGDHGVNMRRGCEAVLSEVEAISSMTLPAAFNAIGMKLVMTIGGASGPLYGSMFLGLSKQVTDNPSRHDFALACHHAVDAVAKRGKSAVGQKTMLDVLVPAAVAFSNGKSLTQVSQIAEESSRATIPMKAARGRASFLGDRSIGHMDPGARSSAIMIQALTREFAN